MIWDRKRRIRTAMITMVLVWLLFCSQRIVAMNDTALRFYGDGAGLLGTIVLGIAGYFLFRDDDFPVRARRVIGIAWGLFFIYSLSDFLDEFLFPPDNPLLGKHQPLHRAIEIVLWTGGYVLAMYGMVHVTLESIAARRAAREEREKGEASSLEKKLAQERLSLFLHAIEQANEGFAVFGFDGIITYANSAFHEMFGLPPGAAIGRDARAFNTSEETPRGSLLAQARASGSWAGVHTLHQANGTPFIAAGSLTMVRDEEGVPAGVVGIVRDITEQKALEEKLRASEERYRLIAEEATDLISTHSRDSHWLYASPSVRHILGYTPEELLGRPAYELMDPVQSETLDSLNPEDFLDPQPQPVPVAMRHKDGHLVHLESRIRTLTPDRDRNPRLLVMSRDVSTRLREEEERRQLELKLQAAQRHESLAFLAGGIAHDFNNLLLVILANADLALSELGPDSTVERYLRPIQIASERAGDLTRQMLTYTGRGEPEPRPVDLAKMVEELAGLLLAGVSKRVRITTDVARDVPSVHGDSTELSQVIMNLITNAAEAIGPQEGAIQINTGTCECSREYLDACVVHDQLPTGIYTFVEVVDSGMGMDQRTIQRIFEPFFTTKFTGRGLGLATVLGIVRRHRGTIAITSKLGKGTTIRALFPGPGIGIK